ncbi:hypothetical protein D3C84_1061750 [compost metagenome]
MLDATLAAELEPDGTTVDFHVTAAQGGQAVRAIVPGVLSVSDADQSRVEQGDDGGQDFISTEAGRGQ